MKLTSLKYSCFVLNGNRKEQLAKIYCRVAEIPVTKLMGSLSDFWRCKSNLG